MGFVTNVDADFLLGIILGVALTLFVIIVIRDFVIEHAFKSMTTTVYGQSGDEQEVSVDVLFEFQKLTDEYNTLKESSLDHYADCLRMIYTSKSMLMYLEYLIDHSDNMEVLMTKEWVKKFDDYYTKESDFFRTILKTAGKNAVVKEITKNYKKTNKELADAIKSINEIEDELNEKEI